MEVGTRYVTGYSIELARWCGEANRGSARTGRARVEDESSDDHVPVAVLDPVDHVCDVVPHRDEQAGARVPLRPSAEPCGYRWGLGGCILWVELRALSTIPSEQNDTTSIANTQYCKREKVGIKMVVMTHCGVRVSSLCPLM